VDAELRGLEPGGFSGAILWVSGDEVVLKKGYGFAGSRGHRAIWFQLTKMRLAVA
jgi:hypothetical protein